MSGSSILFCSKGVVAKLAYRHGVDALGVLALRMGFSLPCFIGMAIYSSRGAERLTGRDFIHLAWLGFVGYYLSALVNFTGLQYVSVGLERILLYTYPMIVLAASRFVLGKAVHPAAWLACLGTWLGIVMAFTGELRNPVAKARTGIGALLILASALTYAVFILTSATVVRRLGAMRFTGIVVGFSGLFILVHYSLARPIGSLLTLPGAVYGEGAVLALFGTVAPAVLMSCGLKRAGAQKFAIISAIGPVMTLFLAWAALGERPNAAQGLGFTVTIAFSLAVSLLKDRPVAALEPGAGISRDARGAPGGSQFP